MSQDQVDRYISIVGHFVQFGSAALLCVLFYLLRRHAARRAYFSIWARSWLVMVVSMATVIAYNISFGSGSGEVSETQRVLLRFTYQFSKLLACALLVIGTRVYAFGVQPRAAYVWPTAAAAAIGLASVALVPVTTRVVVVQAPILSAALAYCGLTLLTLPHSRRSLGSQAVGAIFGVMGAIWTVWFFAYTEWWRESSPGLALALGFVAIHNGYIDALLQMLLGSGMVVMLMEDGKREADDARAELAVAHDKLRRDALYDSLTGSLNRRAFAEGVGLEMARATFGAVVVLDMDNLKQVNDTAGHAGGDELLQHLATNLRSIIRPSDRLYRWGGDEFLIVFPGARGIDVQARVEQAIAEAPAIEIAGLAEPVHLGASVGSSDYASAEELAHAIERADGVMYRHKKARRTRERTVDVDTPTPRPRVMLASE